MTTPCFEPGCFVALMPSLANTLPFWLGYMTILAVPGPNNILIATLTAAHGFRATIGLKFAIAIGAATQAVLISQLVTILPDSNTVHAVFPFVSAILLLCIAWRIVRLQPPTLHERCARRRADIGVGFLCGITNIITIAFFTSQFLDAGTEGASLMALEADGAYQQSETARQPGGSVSIPPLLLAIGVLGLSMISTTLTAFMFGLPAIRRRVLDNFSLIRWGTCALFCTASGATLFS
ncbi:MAG: LysE family translocator [Bosea sp. (in: a-proteobacteria)]